jgi:polyribonucleotide nucleotidyltransferase
MESPEEAIDPSSGPRPPSEPSQPADASRPVATARRTSFEIDGREIVLETGKLARQADGAVLVRQGRAVVLVTVVAAKRDTDPGFLPLTVEYREKSAAAGRVPGSFLRREGRITDDEVLSSRILDRSIRPLFPKGLRQEVQVQATVLSADPAADETAILALIGASAALHVSALPWDGPIGGVRMVRADGRWTAFAGLASRKAADGALVVAGGAQGLVMVEGEARELPEAEILEGLFEAQTRISRCCEAIEELRRIAGVPKAAAPGPAAAGELPASLGEELERRAAGLLDEALFTSGKKARADRVAAVLDSVTAESLAAAGPTKDGEHELRGACRDHLRGLARARIREAILAEGRRIDGRAPDEIRPIHCEVDWLPSPHGSALFTRGETQALVTCTLASRRMEQMQETLHGPRQSRFLLHYNFPSYSVGEIRPLRGPGRREIGHGNLARRALEPVLPNLESFPYVVRLESDIAESNGSSSMATTCGGCLALMDAGVPIRSMVAGIAMGLVSDGARFQVLSDILGDEDHVGDMDFKVTGTRDGITALQMDNKLGALPREVLVQALEQARSGRLHILGAMEKTLARSRSEPKEHAPRITPVRIVPAAISALIGPKGSNIKSIEAEFDAEITLDEAGLCFVHARDASKARGAVRRVQQAAGVVEVGRVYAGTVVTVKEFGAFVKIFESAEGLVPVAEWDEGYVENLPKIVRPGEKVHVRVLGVDGRGKIRLSRKDALDLGGEDVVNA